MQGRTQSATIQHFYGHCEQNNKIKLTGPILSENAAECAAQTERQ